MPKAEVKNHNGTPTLFLGDALAALPLLWRVSVLTRESHRL